MYNSIHKKSVPPVAHARNPRPMKVVDVSRFEVVRAGVPCFTPPPVNVETIAKLMERNEDYIFWLQPPGGGVEQQLACVQINSVFYQLNMRLEKAIFRHIRLNRDFQNLEKLEDGTPKLRIPTRLLREKMRTSQRSKVRSRVCIVYQHCQTL